jgi:hypothetical protein
MIDKTKIIEFQGRLLIIKRTIREEHRPNVDVWKEHLNADTVLRKDGWFYFCESIQDVEILTEPETTKL